MAPITALRELVWSAPLCQWQHVSTLPHLAVGVAVTPTARQITDEPCSRVPSGWRYSCHNAPCLAAPVLDSSWGEGSVTQEDTVATPTHRSHTTRLTSRPAQAGKRGCSTSVVALCRLLSRM